MGLVFWGLDLIYFDVIRLDDLVTQPMCDVAATAKQRCVGKGKKLCQQLPNNCSSANHLKAEVFRVFWKDWSLWFSFLFLTIPHPSSDSGPSPSNADHHGGGPRDANVINERSTYFRGCLKNQWLYPGALGYPIVNPFTTADVEKNHPGLTLIHIHPWFLTPNVWWFISESVSKNINAISICGC